MGNGQAVRHWVLVPGSGVRIPLPQPCKMTARSGGHFALLGVIRTTGDSASWRIGGSAEQGQAQEYIPSMAAAEKRSAIPLPQPSFLYLLFLVDHVSVRTY